MASMETRYSIAKLNGDNYFNWRYKMEMMLKEKSVWSAIFDEVVPKPVTSAWKEKDERAHSTIALNVEDDQIQHIRNCKSAKEAWNALKNFHETNSPSNRVHILRTIMKQRLEEGGDAEQHVSKMNELFQKFMALGENISPEFFMSATLMGSLPESYDSLITALEARSEEDLTSNLVRTKVVAEYKRRIIRQQSDSDVALQIKVGTSKWISCYFCKTKGHLKKDCVKYKEWLTKRNERNFQKANFTEVDSDSSSECLFLTEVAGDGWVIDSGATCHIVSVNDVFDYFNPQCREKVSVASGQQLVAS